jgi:hypothetical protein
LALFVAVAAKFDAEDLRDCEDCAFLFVDVRGLGYFLLLAGG